MSNENTSQPSNEVKRWCANCRYAAMAQDQLPCSKCSYSEWQPKVDSIDTSRMKNATFKNDYYKVTLKAPTFSDFGHSDPITGLWVPKKHVVGNPFTIDKKLTSVSKFIKLLEEHPPASLNKPGEDHWKVAKAVEVFNVFHDTKLTKEQGLHFLQILKDVRVFTMGHPNPKRVEAA